MDECKLNTVNGERFAGLNFRGFYPMKFFTGKLLWYLTFTTLKQRHYTKLAYISKYSRKNFCGAFENCEKCES